MKTGIYLLVVLAALFLTGFKDSRSSASGQVVAPNILFIMSDDHALSAVSAYSDHLIETLHIDRLANEGMIFYNAFVLSITGIVLNARIVGNLETIQRQVLGLLNMNITI